MAHHFSLREVNQNFSRYIRSVEEGNEIILTRHGKTVAKIVPVQEEQKLTPAQEAAKERLFEIMKTGFIFDHEPFDRESLHDR